MSITFDIKGTDVVLKLTEEALKKVEGKFDQALQDAATELVVRTRQGKDVDGNAFDEYTPEYAKFKGSKGRKSTPPDLTFTGAMLASITTKVETVPDGKVGTIYFGSAREAVKARGNQERRKFFGLSEAQVRRMIEKLSK